MAISIKRGLLMKAYYPNDGSSFGFYVLKLPAVINSGIFCAGMIAERNT
jgi:hypothetical protein